MCVSWIVARGSSANVARTLVAIDHSEAKPQALAVRDERPRDDRPRRRCVQQRHVAIGIELECGEPLQPVAWRARGDSALIVGRQRAESGRRRRFAPAPARRCPDVRPRECPRSAPALANADPSRRRVS